MLPRITYIVKAFDNLDKLEDTIQSISGINQKTNVYIAIVSTQNNVDLISNILNSNKGVPEKAPKVFNKFPFGTPTFCVCFGEGKIRESDVLNTIINETKFTEIYTVCNSGDKFNINHPLFIQNTIKECPGVVGLIYTDYYDNGLRIHAYPYIKEIFNLINTTRYSFPAYVTENLPIPDGTEKEFQTNLINKYMAVQIPYPLIRINNE